MSNPDSSDVPRTAYRRAGDAARLDRIFGEVLPRTTADERGDDRPSGGDSDNWLRSQVPPHHGHSG
ncbi:hypothetical protein B0T36_13080 [Nocardia donostiensis]|uniref:hypothetical protein n=1 Tax=Nocardia donostiensis TaxID=1538463 RepID=UPI0009D9921B|nr:hypothetical protein [Nocardia donostiensis]OQS14472.1 hypothetical protein B0T36_13080 [Nocardia donostiensis]